MRSRPDYPFRPHYYNISPHARMHYIDEGHGDVIVMVHGNPTWSYYYRRMIRLLAKEHRVLAVDHIGCGMSDKPQDYNYCLGNHIENLRGLLAHLEIDTFSLCVHDWGGAIGFGAVADRPEALRKVMVLNTAAFRSSQIPFRIRVCRWPLLGELLVRGLNGFAGPAVFMAVSRKMDKEVASAYLEPYDSWKNRVAVFAFVRDIPLSPSHPSYDTLVMVEKSLARLQEMKVPMLICWGGKDFCFNNDFYEEWRSRFSHADCHYFKNSGHYVLEDSWSEISPLARSFFRE